MLLFFVLGILYAFLSLPLFPYLFFESTNRPLSPNDRKNANADACETIIVFIFICIISFSASFFVYTTYQPNRLWYVYLFPIVVPLIFQILYAALILVKKYVPITIITLGIILCLSIVFPIRDLCLPYVDSISTNNTGIIVENAKPLLDNNQLSQRFEITKILNSSYDKENSTYIYVVNTKEGYGVIENSETQTIFYPCKVSADINRVQNKYPSHKIVYLGVDLSDKENIYAYYAILGRNGFFERPTIEKEIKLNLNDGEISDLK